ncbi:MAG: hypothetical protein ACXVPP_11665, partial [Actinomycetota bacterium]
VEVRTPRITIRGLDRNKVLVDGEFKRTNGILVNGADGVTVENLTACCNTKNGVLWSGVKGYEGHYLTAYNNGDYGIFAYDSTGRSGPLGSQLRLRPARLGLLHR